MKRRIVAAVVVAVVSQPGTAQEVNREYFCGLFQQSLQGQAISTRQVERMYSLQFWSAERHGDFEGAHRASEAMSAQRLSYIKSLGQYQRACEPQYPYQPPR
jgi:hypothetical protein